MLISVIIPCFNSEKYLYETIQSVLNQSHQEIEIICVDNGSTDNTISIVKKLIEENKNIHLIHEPRKGANYARNTGLSYAKGYAVQFLDSDDLIHPDKFNLQLKKLQSGFDVVVSDRAIFNYDLSQKINEITFEEIESQTLKTCISKIIITGNPLYKLDSIIEINGWNETLITAQDWEFHINLALNNKKFGYLPGVLLNSRNHNESLSSNWVKVSFDGVKVLDMHQQKIMANAAYLNIEVKMKIFQVYYSSAIHSQKKDQRKDYSKKLESWKMNNYYTKFLNRKDKILLNLVGINKLIIFKNWLQIKSLRK